MEFEIKKQYLSADYAAVDVSRFEAAQKMSFETAYNEIRNGRKYSHWIWYVFPQIDGLVRNPSYNTAFYSIKSAAEAVSFLKNDYLAENMQKICLALLSLASDNPIEVMGVPDNMKLQSSMTLFAFICEEGSIFQKVLDKFFNSRPDYKTLNIIEKL